MPSQFGGVPVDTTVTEAAPNLGSMFAVNPADAPGDPVEGLPPLPNISAHRNEKFLQTLPTGIASTIRAMADGRAEPPSGFLLKTPFGQHLQAALATYAPDFDLANVKSRIAMRKSATSGPLGTNIASLNTVAGHLKQLYDSVDGLHNSNNPWYNANIADPLSNQDAGKDPGFLAGSAANIGGMLGVNDTSYQAALKKFESGRQAAASELTRAFRGATGNEADIQAYKALFNEHAAPDVIKAAIKDQVGKLMSRLHAAADQYNRGMGTTATPFQFLTPENAKIFQELAQGSDNGAAPSQSAATGIAHPADIDAILKKYGGQ